MHSKLWVAHLRDVMAVLAASFLLAHSFPSDELTFRAFLAWIVLVPMIYFFETSHLIKRMGLSILWTLAAAAIAFRGVPAAVGHYFDISGPVLISAIAILSWGHWIIFGLFMGWVRQLPYGFLYYPLLWVGVEYLMGLAGPQLRFMTLGLTQVNLDFMTPLARSAGVYGLSFWVVAVNAILYQWLKLLLPSRFFLDSAAKPPVSRKALFWATGIMIVFGVFFKWQSQESAIPLPRTQTSVKMALIQPNIYPHSLTQDDVYQERYDKLKELTWTSIQNGAQLVFWPAASIQAQSKMLMMTHFNFLRYIRGTSELVLGALLDREHDGRLQRFNIILHVNLLAQMKGYYTKKKLTPYSEYVPWFCPDFFGANEVNQIPYAASQEGDMIFHFNDLSWANLICAEVLYPRLIRRFINEGAQMLAVFSNDYMYHETPFMQYMLALSKLRAKEFGIPVLRITPSGLTVCMDPWGHVIGEIQEHDTGVLYLDFDIKPHVTFYCITGDWLAIVCALILGAAWMIRLRSMLEKE